LDLSLQDKVAIVTGGSSGIGRATAQAFAREGAKVVIADINAAGGEETVKLIKKAGGEATYIKTDVRKAADVENMVKKTVQKYGKLNCALNAAGIEGKLTNITECEEDEWDDVNNTNLKGVWLSMKYEILQMIQNGGGAIVNIASVAGLIGFDRMIPYGTSKHGVVFLTKSAALMYTDKGIRFNAICPGSINTPMFARLAEATNNPNHVPMCESQTPALRLGKPEEIANTVVWLCSNAASFVNGSALTVDGGQLAGHYQGRMEILSE
jgi:NAD(P)-dependent dehydrogenase (short-subunit alcohol dehydrogenase family)